ncbi:hypothetical protein ASD44_05410 [Mesorhizobium sp. Root554]|nr:hypothetical protein ASD27_05415 [Mesorhizobium sp. Root1471]KQZ36084.1 hypothetical protein ASD44_05410 [Mesorhizobium sp. Root554]
MRHTKEGITGLLYRKPLDFSNGAAAFPELIFHEDSNGWAIFERTLRQPIAIGAGVGADWRAAFDVTGLARKPRSR